MNKKRNFWRNKNVFITGVGGFVGSNLTKDLLKNEARIIGLTKNKNIDSLLYYEGLEKK